jgi:serine/threonine-protein kinase
VGLERTKLERSALGALASIPSAVPGAVVAGKYRVERVLGSGGMGVVVAAQHLQLGQLVALKFPLKEAYESSEALNRFLREGQALARIRSHHVARVMDVGTLEQGEPYLVMEYLEGSDLGSTLKQQGPLAVADAVAYVLQASEAIAEAHAAGIVHRDLKPSNLFLTKSADGTPLVKVLDFGISKAILQQLTEPLGSHTSTGALVGSPLYMAPEQIRNARRVDGRADVWATGVILHELISGKPPFGGDTLAATLAAVAADAPEPIRSLRPDVSAQLEAVILRCLEKDPDRRYGSVAELAKALVDFAPVQARDSIERITRVLGAELLMQAPAPSVPPPAVAPRERRSISLTAPSWEGDTAAAQPGTDRISVTARIGLAIALSALAAVMFVLLRGSTLPESSAPAASAGESVALARSSTPAAADSPASVPAAAAARTLAAVPSAEPPRSALPASSAKTGGARQRVVRPRVRAPSPKPLEAVTENDGLADRE